jgi:oligosaccharide 4-alpha-D-glucosyltransferase
MKNFFLLFSVLLYTFLQINILHAQKNVRKFIGMSQNAAGLQINVSDGHYLFKSYSPKIVECTFVPLGQTFNPNSHAVIAKLVDDPFQKFEDNGSLYFNQAEGIIIEVVKDPFKIVYWNNNEKLIEESLGYTKDDEHEKLHFKLLTDEALFGSGARALGMNRRGHRLPLYNRAHYGYEDHSEQMNFSMPIVLSSRGYMLHFDNAPTGFLDLDAEGNNALVYETVGGRKTYQIIVGESWKDLLTQYTHLTGRQPLPPRWAFGNFASRFGYHSEREAKEVVTKFQQENIPLDAIIFDLYWFGKEIQGTMGNLEFYRDSFPNPDDMIANFNARKIKTVLITEPFILSTSKKWNEAVEKKILATDLMGNPFKYDFYFGNTGLIDIYQSHARQWFWDIYKDLINRGVKGIWGDLGEPEVHPKELRHANFSADEVHNIYGHDWARLIADGYKKDFPKERPFVLMRAGYSGSQRFGMIPWSGDVNRTWGGFRRQPEIALQMGLQGMGYMHSDLGGFAGANDDPELYVRWLQYGVFQPIFRPHAQEEVASEPIFKDANTKQLAKEAIEWRYRLLPYNYTLAYQNATKGWPLMRPLFFENKEEINRCTEDGLYFWGDAFLVAPVQSPKSVIGDSISILLPKQGVWFDWFSGKRMIPSLTVDNDQSFSYIHQKLEENQIPVFVKSGSFVPHAELVQQTDNYQANASAVHFYWDNSLSSSKGQWYEDNGYNAKSLEEKDFTILNFSYQKLSSKKGEIKIEISGKTGTEAYVNQTKVIVFGANNIKSIKLNGKKLKMTTDTKNETKSFILPLHITHSTVELKW